MSTLREKEDFEEVVIQRLLSPRKRLRSEECVEECSPPHHDTPHHNTPLQDVPSPSRSTSHQNTPPIIQFTDEHKRALDLFEEGKNILITGPAGTGKTTLLREIIKRSEKMSPRGPRRSDAFSTLKVCCVGGVFLSSLLLRGSGNCGGVSLGRLRGVSLTPSFAVRWSDILRSDCPTFSEDVSRSWS